MISRGEDYDEGYEDGERAGHTTGYDEGVADTEARYANDDREEVTELEFQLQDIVEMARMLGAEQAHIDGNLRIAKQRARDYIKLTRDGFDAKYGEENKQIKGLLRRLG